jgi:hypothetical protein
VASSGKNTRWQRWQHHIFSLSVDGQLKYAASGRNNIGAAMQVDDCCDVWAEDANVVLQLDCAGEHTIKLKATSEGDAFAWCSAIETVILWCEDRSAWLKTNFQSPKPISTTKISKSFTASFLKRRKMLEEASVYLQLQKFVVGHVAACAADPSRPKLESEEFAQAHASQLSANNVKYPPHILQARSSQLDNVLCRHQHKAATAAPEVEAAVPEELPNICSTSSVYEHREQQELISLWLAVALQRAQSLDSGTLSTDAISTDDPSDSAVNGSNGGGRSRSGSLDSGTPSGSSNAGSRSRSGSLDGGSTRSRGRGSTGKRSPGKVWRTIFQRFGSRIRGGSHDASTALQNQPSFIATKRGKHKAPSRPSRLAKRRSLRLSEEKMAIVYRAKLVEVQERRRWHAHCVGARSSGVGRAAAA